MAFVAVGVVTYAACGVFLSTIGAAHECVKTSKELHGNGHLAHASVKLSLEMLKIANAIREYSGEESGNSQAHFV